MDGWMDTYIEIKAHAEYGYNYESTTRVSLVLWVLWYKQKERKSPVYDAWTDGWTHVDAFIYLSLKFEF